MDRTIILVAAASILFLITSYGSRWSTLSRFKGAYKPIRYELIELHEILTASLASGEAHARDKIAFVVQELRKLT